jgi:hypothetical protein
MHNGYNCIAWAVGDTERWWCPTGRRGISYWPKWVPRLLSVEAYIQALGTCGFTLCDDASLQDGIEKVALFARIEQGKLVPTHAALQLECGEWTSKLGTQEDVKHATLDAVSGPLYGEAVRYVATFRCENEGPSAVS